MARTEARNFYWSFLPLPARKRAAMCAIYAFMRFSDDISDEAGAGPERTGRMQAWRAELDRALAGDFGDRPLWPAFHDTVRRYSIPHEYFHQLVDGTEMDLEPREYRTFQDTYRYCYHVAGVVGLVCIHVFGFREPRALKLAEYNGLAFQLTNILRDLREDAAMGRIYLPREELERFGYSPDDLRAGVDSPAFRELMRFQVGRARDYYDRAAPLLGLVDPDSRPCLWAMRAIYAGILDRIERQGFDVFRHRARVSTWRKLAIVCGALARARWGGRETGREAASST